ncbi:MAG: LamG-like jellyroll fold domain-containing protein, partial [Planctomycetota bacterium]
MSKKIILLTVIGLMLAMSGSVNAAFTHKFDIAVNASGPLADSTDKSLQPGHGDWKAWRRYGDDKETHDATHQVNVGGTGITIGIGAGDGSSSPGTVLDFTTDANAICNSWIRAGLNGFEDDGYEGPGHPTFSIWLILSGPGLLPGTYEVHGYHNSLGDDQPNLLPKVHVQTSYGANNPLDNFGPDANDADGNGVVVEFNDVNVAVLHVTDDDLLDPNVSVVRFFTDGSPVAISYQAEPNQTAIINAFTVIQTFSTPFAEKPFPEHGEGRACPDAGLYWSPGTFADTHNVYFVMDTNEPNLADEMPMFNDYIEGGDANWSETTNWTVYDSNVLEDGNNDGNAASSYHSFAAGSGLGTLTTVDINTIGARTMRLALSVKHTLGTEAGDILLDYWDGSSWDYIADLNSVGPNDVWATFTDDINESEYIRDDFKVRIRSDIPGGGVEVYVDNLSITNTWPVYSKYLVSTGTDVNNWTPPSDLELGKTYYWRVDEVNDSNADSPWRGWLWEFTTDTGKAIDPDPANNEGFQPSDTTITLSWTSSCLASGGDYVYFSTSFDDVNEANTNYRYGPIATSEFVTPTLSYSEKYYWKVVSIGGGDPNSDVWAFQTEGYPLMYFDFQGGVIDANIGNIDDANFITDSLGNVTFSITHNSSDLGESKFIYDEGNPLYNVPGTSGRFKHTDANWPDEERGVGSRLLRTCSGPDLLDLNGSAYTIESWVRQDGPAAGIRDNDLQGTILRKDDDGSYGLGIDDDGAVKFMHAGQWISSEQTFSRVSEGVWHHIAAVFDAGNTTDQLQKLYIDGLLVADNNDDALNPQDVHGSDYVGIGAFLNQGTAGKQIGNYFNGAIDELRVVAEALDPNNFLIRGDPALAWLPRPSHYATEVPYDANLGWNSGDYGDSHDVYFGTIYDDVNDADTTTAGIFIDNRTNNDYNPPGDFALDTTYYWRIDEVDDSNGYRWKGTTWRFTVANYIIIDDFESYTYPPDNLWYTWENPHWTGSFVELGREGYDPVDNGNQSMKYGYDITEYGWDTYAEVERWFASPQDWDSADVKMVTLSFYGQAGNNANNSRMSIGLEDGDSNSFVDYDGDMNDIRIEEWQEWNLALPDFTGVDMTDVRTIYIRFGDPDAGTPGGSGTVYFDDIRIYPPRCIPSEGPAYDFDDDCIVGFAEIAMMGREWLIRDRYVSPIEAPSPTSVLRYQFDESAGTTLEDSANDYDGTFITDVNQGPNDISVHMDSGGMSGNSFHFFSNDDPNDGLVASTGGIMIDPNVWTDNGILQEITVAMWIRNVHTDEDAAENEAFMFEFREW